MPACKPNRRRNEPQVFLVLNVQMSERKEATKEKRKEETAILFGVQNRCQIEPNAKRSEPQDPGYGQRPKSELPLSRTGRGSH